MSHVEPDGALPPAGRGRRIARLSAMALWPGLLLASVSCNSSPDFPSPEGFDFLPELQDLNFDRVQPAEEYQIWELRLEVAGNGDSVIGGGGTVLRSALQPAVLAEFDGTRPQSGFGAGCPPGDCFMFAVAVRAGEVSLWNTTEELAEFLGQVESREEAAVVVAAHGYHWTPETRETGAVRDMGGGFDFLALRTEKLCDPVQVNRYLLHVSSSGALNQVEFEVWSKEDAACV